MIETILIIDDEKDILELLSKVLKSEGYNIITASNGREGIDKFFEYNPDLILTDVRMPVMDGLDFLREVKSKLTDTEVIILTGHSDEATAVDCLRYGAYDYFRKPLEDIEILLTAVRRVLDKKQLEVKNRSLVKQLEELSIKDPLTGIFNYRHLQVCFDDEIERCKRYAHSFFVLMIDADHFKAINDNFGHLFGDHVLKELCEIISSVLRSTDRLFRYGGEEFLVIMHEITQDQVITVVNRLLFTIRNHTFRHDNQETKMTVSMGGAFFPDDAIDKVQLIKAADKSLYKAKNSGRNRFECRFYLAGDAADRGIDPLKKDNIVVCS